MTVPGDRFLGATRGFDEAIIALFGCPYDETVTFRPGARWGPSAIREVSDVLETYSPELGNDLGDIPFCDMGDLTLDQGRVELVLEAISDRAQEVFAAGKIPFALGGEHLISLPLIIKTLEHHPDLVVFHWDAHADLRNDYEGAVLSYATVMRRVAEAIGGDRLVQFGIRSGTREEWEWMKGREERVDVDVLDPSVCPGTGTPEPGGTTFQNLIDCIYTLRRSGAPIVALDVVELAPKIDPSGISAAAAAKIVRELLLSLRV